ncbi:MAG: hypothetical protein FWC34_11030 [Bacteroidetes bacterium]|nr:hypothetical protein [Bacteroidota bacterium]MCL2302925.1 hypothetical protein [Lentimicrobiaceae bacterium]
MAKKGYNRLNYLKHCKIVIDIVNAHYRVGYTTYSGIFRTFVEPFYPMSYKSFMKIINMPSIDKQIERELERIGKPTPEVEKNNLNQLELF